MTSWKRLALLLAVTLGVLGVYARWADAQADAGAPEPAPVRRLRARQIHPRSYILAGRDYLAAEAGDLDGDGKSEILLVRAGSVGIVRVPERGARVEVLGSQALPPLAAPLLGRRPFAVARVAQGVAYVRISQRPAAVEARLTGAELSLREIPPRCGALGYDLGDACALLVQGRDYFASQLRALPAEQGVRAEPAPAASSFYVRRVRSFALPDGARARVEALVNPSGRLLTSVESRAASLLGVGAALALGDLDGDGEPELLTSTATAPERLQLFRLRLRDGRITRLYRSPVLDGRVMVAGAGDLDGDGDDELFAIEEPTGHGSARLWVLP
ncbi:MAG: hypothetical protein GXP55_05930 [Deltaproteobacteria bacterium]|nr:hypothetical protein [Deltaproteobacteria bacterium]